MADLSKLYLAREVFTEYNAEIPIELQNQIKEAEHDLIQNKISDIFLETLPATINIAEIKSPITMAVTYVDGNLHYLGYSLEENIIDKFTVIEDFSDDVSDDDGKSGRRGKRSSSIPFTVRFIKEGKEIRCKKSLDTMIETLKFMGFEKVAEFQEETFAGYPLVGKKQRVTEGDPRPWQKQVDGWWIYVNMPNFRKIACLKKVADFLGYEIEIRKI